MWKTLRWATLILATSNIILITLGINLIVSIAKPARCGRSETFALIFVLCVALSRIVWMVATGVAQRATATSVLSIHGDGGIDDNVLSDEDAVVRLERRVKYKRWLWWMRLGNILSVMQFVGATYFMFNIVKYAPNSASESIGCFTDGKKDWKGQKYLILYILMMWFAMIVQCITGSDVLRWRSFYATHDSAWKAHYSEVFDHGIREALCCLGRVKYLSVLEEDEVSSVARLLGDLVAYRASGTGHLELLTGLALLQKPKEVSTSDEYLREAPEKRIHEAAAFHQFAEAAYTGPLLDFGRNPVLFPCAWLYRQGILSPWSRNRRPVLQGDNWWRGHAAAFLRYVNQSPEALRRGRVCQAKFEAAYFIVVLHHMKTVVIAVRGTETPEDLITDGLCVECSMNREDLDGLIGNNHIDTTAKKSIISSFPHYGHSGIVEAARELCTQIDEISADNDNPYAPTGFLSSLMGDGCECHGYDIRIVGHSLGGAIGTLLGLKLYGRYPNLHVYAYGTLPCVDSVIAEACSEFVTSIVYNDEFSSRLSVNSILRLREAALSALSEDSSADSAMILKLARRVLVVNKQNKNKVEAISPTTYERSKASLSFTDPVSNFIDSTGSSNITPVVNPQELYLPGLIIHIVPQQKSSLVTLWKIWRTSEGVSNYKAYTANRESFKDIVVSPFMFLDHLPWRCHYAMQKVLETHNIEVQNGESHIV